MQLTKDFLSERLSIIEAEMKNIHAQIQQWMANYNMLEGAKNETLLHLNKLETAENTAENETKIEEN